MYVPQHISDELFLVKHFHYRKSCCCRKSAVASKQIDLKTAILTHEIGSSVRAYRNEKFSAMD